MKEILERIFAILFSIFKILPVNKNKISFIMTHDDKFNGNIKYIYLNIIEKHPEYKINIISRKDYEVGKIKSLLGVLSLLRKVVQIYFIKNYHLATSKEVYLNNIFITAAYLKFKSEVRVIQVWHAIGTFKKFGEEYKPSDKIDRLQKKANSIYTEVWVASKKDIEIYAKAFNISKKKVRVIKSPICKFFEDESKVDKVKQRIYKAFPELLGKKILLYAPTFRDDDKTNLKILEFAKIIGESISDDKIILLRLHPHIYKKYNYSINCNRIIDFSKYEDVNELMLITDVLITDYSSLFYEFTYLEKPILFFAFDLDKYEQERGFYYKYDMYVPGQIFRSLDDLITVILNDSYVNKSKEFKKEYYKINGSVHNAINY